MPSSLRRITPTSYWWRSASFPRAACSSPVRGSWSRAWLTWDCGVGPVGQRILAALREPCAIEGRVVTVGASVGLVIPDGDDADLSADALMRRADAAMYAGKRRGKGALVRYTGGGSADVDLPRLLAREIGEHTSELQ